MHRLSQLAPPAGGLLTVRHPHLIERYNRALEALTGKRTALATFRIDATGFSPEIAEEIADADYMNPNGVNRRYILVSMHQADLPVLDQRFTSTRWLMRAFVEQNRDALFLLTSKDVVYGELEDNTYKVNSLDDLLSIKKVVFTVTTPTKVAEKAARLTRMVTEFTASDSMWMREEVVAEMVELAKQAGDVRRNSSVPGNLVFHKGNFHSTHLGGLWVFHHQDKVTVIHEDPAFACALRWQNRPVQPIHVGDVEGVVNFLIDSDLVHLPTRALVQARREALARKLEFLVVDFIAAIDPFRDLSDFDYEETKGFIYRHHDELPKAFHQIARALKFCDAGLEWDVSECDAQAIAYMTSGKPGDDRDLVNHLLAHVTPADYLRCWEHNQPLFRARYDSWSEARRSYVYSFLERRQRSRAAAVLDMVHGYDDSLDDVIPGEDPDDQGGAASTGPWARRALRP